MMKESAAAGCLVRDRGLPEERVVEMWRQLPGRDGLVTEEGEPVRIVYPGRRNDGRGADLIDAVIDTDGGRVQGDVEVHVRSSGWRAHGHHRDPAYNGVILHVAYERDSGPIIDLENGQRAPTLALQRFMEQQREYTGIQGTAVAEATMPCRGATAGRTGKSVETALDEAGDTRFRARTAAFRERLAAAGPEQCLYAGILTALGYTKNTSPMSLLARRLPLDRLEASVHRISETDTLPVYQALLLGSAGLLPSQRAVKNGGVMQDDARVAQLETAWAKSGMEAVISENDWQTFRVRPGNFPVRRLAAMGCLLDRYGETGLFAGLAGPLQREMVETSGTEPAGMMTVGAGDYWSRYLDFGRPVSGAAPALLGEGRAADIVVNVLLPLAAARGENTADTVLAENARAAYRRHPATPGNTLERHMLRQLGRERARVTTARRQQGLLHIYRTLCTQGKCDDCPLAGTNP